MLDTTTLIVNLAKREADSDPHRQAAESGPDRPPPCALGGGAVRVARLCAEAYTETVASQRIAVLHMLYPRTDARTHRSLDALVNALHVHGLHQVALLQGAVRRGSRGCARCRYASRRMTACSGVVNPDAVGRARPRARHVTSGRTLPAIAFSPRPARRQTAFRRPSPAQPPGRRSLR